MKNGNGRISFERLRKTARAVKEAQCWDKDQLDLKSALEQGLLPELTSRSLDEESRLHVLLALLEWQRLSGLHRDLEVIFHAVADIIKSGEEERVKEAIVANYDASEMVGLVDWLIHEVGTLASFAAIETKKDKRHRKATSTQTISSITSPASLLNCLCHLSQDTAQSGLPPSYFHVVALDDYLKACKWNAEMLESCCKFSGIISTSTKFEQFRKDLEIRRQRQDQEQMFSEIYTGGNYQRSRTGNVNERRKLKVRREDILEDSMILVESDESLLSGVLINFVGEEGEDAGGLTKEWVLLTSQQLVKRIFHQREKRANGLDLRSNSLLPEVELMGVILGLALLAQIAVDISLPSSVYALLLSRPPCSALADLEEIRPTLASGLSQILFWEELDFTERLSMNFTCTSSENHTVQLISDGDRTPVTYSNRHTYVQRMCEYIVVEETQEQRNALQRGFHRVCQDIPSLRLFSLGEFESLLCGKEVPLSVAFIRRLCSVDRRGHVNDESYLDQFWSVLEEDDEPNILRSLLHFVTANHRISLTTGKESFALHLVILHGQEFINRLPTASTCTNTLFLPRYPSRDLLRSRLLIALRQGSVGFGLK
ncbi:hypothetical protein CBS101457_004206 [Exobasidium rhododendri]|nr:hypothetical protein CBS101457_004206 [Exobasidium rhododendri]